MPTLRAVHYVCELDPDCLTKCERHSRLRRYRVHGVVHDPDGSRWPETVDAAFRGQYEVVVLCSWDHLPADRIPRMEVAEPPDEDSVNDLRRRPGMR